MTNRLCHSNDTVRGRVKSQPLQTGCLTTTPYRVIGCVTLDSSLNLSMMFLHPRSHLSLTQALICEEVSSTVKCYINAIFFESWKMSLGISQMVI